MLSLGFILAFIGAAVALLIGILIFSEVSSSIDCPKTSVTNPTGQGKTACNNAKDTAWTVIGILPVALFFALFAIFGALGGRQ
jgi:CDP-diglyceride synthetase